MKLLEHRFGYGLTITILALCAIAAVMSLQFQAVSQWFPLFVSVTGVILAVMVLAADIVGDRRAIGRGVAPEDAPSGASMHDDTFEQLETGTIRVDEDEEDEPARRVLLGFAKYYLWLIAFIVGMLLFGMPIAVFAWLLAFVRFAAKESWLRALLSGLIMTTFLFLFAAFLALALPDGLLIDSSSIIPVWRF